MHSIEVLAERENEMNGQLVEYGIEMDTTKEVVWTKKDEQGDPKKAWKWLDWGCNMFEMSLAFLAHKVWVHVASFGSVAPSPPWYAALSLGKEGH